MDEFGLIATIANMRNKLPQAIADIGDDCFLFDSNGQTLAVTKDLLIENVHFRTDLATFYDIGIRSAAANLSDIAAMGARPMYCFLGLGMPPNTSQSDAQEFMAGFLHTMERYGCALAGGDTVRAESWSVSVTVIGICQPTILRRSSFRPGQVLAATGTLGDSAAGLQLLIEKDSGRRVSNEAREFLIARHMRPTPRIEEALLLAEMGIDAGMDISDGIASDIFRIVQASGTGATIYEDDLPTSKAFDEFCKAYQVSNPQRLALSGGEDFELLLGIDKHTAEDVIARFEQEFPDVPITIIGETDDSGIVKTKDGTGKEHPVPSPSFSHF